MAISDYDDDVELLHDASSYFTGSIQSEAITITPEFAYDLESAGTIEQEIEIVKIGSLLVHAGATLELSPDGGSCGRFLQVTKILCNPSDTSRITFEGHLFQRSTSLSVGHRYLNEISMIIEKLGHHLDDSVPIKARVPISKLLMHNNAPVLRHLVMTADACPAHNPAIGLGTLAEKDHCRATGPLICRTIYTTVRKRKSDRKPFTGSIRYIRRSESDVSHTAGIPSETHVMLNLSKARLMRQVIYCCGCCGGGGDAEGAHQAGCRLRFCWDRFRAACRTVKANHPGADVYCLDAQEALDLIEHYHVDILHLSWPCQAFCPQNRGLRRQSHRHDENTAAFLGTAAHLRKFKPLYLTMENTSGMHDFDLRDYVDTVLSDIVAEGYNVSWTITNFIQYGLAASRNRIILFASHRDVPMAHFPPASHGDIQSGLLPYTTLGTVLNRVPLDASLHMDTARSYSPPKPTTSANTQINCIMTKGDPIHPSGLRSLSIRELAYLQGFPMDYIFRGTRQEMKTQIGNAVPPNVWSVFIGSIVNTIYQWRTGVIDDEGRPIVEE